MLHYRSQATMVHLPTPKCATCLQMPTSTYSMPSSPPTTTHHSFSSSTLVVSWVACIPMQIRTPYLSHVLPYILVGSMPAMPLWVQSSATSHGVALPHTISCRRQTTGLANPLQRNLSMLRACSTATSIFTP